VRTPRDDARQCGVLAAAAGVILLAYWFVMTRVAVPGGPAGDLTPAHDLGSYVDRALMSGHLYRGTWDPEGLLSTAPAVATTLVGAIAGVWLQAPVPTVRKVLTLGLAGAALFLGGEAWNAAFPINKALWTSSYVLLTAGAAAIILAACIHLIDVRGFSRWSRPFVVLGSNAIFLFVASGLIGKTIILVKVGSSSLQSVIYERGFAWMAAPHNASLLYAFAFLAMMYGMCRALYRRGIFFKA